MKITLDEKPVSYEVLPEFIEGGGTIGEDGVPEVGVSSTKQTQEKLREAIRYKKSQLNVLTFPLDLNQKDMPHVLFKIFPTVTGEVESQNQNPTQTSIGAGIGVVGEKFSEVANKAAELGRQGLNAVESSGSLGAAAVNAATYGVDKLKSGVTGLVQKGGESIIGSEDIVADVKKSFSNFSLNRNADQLAAAIALFMPDGISTNYSHSYDELSLTSTLGGAGLFLQALGSKTGSAATRDAFIVEGAASLAGNVLQVSPELTNALVFATTGKAINPQLEMLYKSPNLRTFTFDFRLVPRNQSEAATIVGIINLLKHHSSPEIPSGTTGRYFIPPSRFEIEFYNDKTDSSNPYLFKTKKCVLTDISVDYSPNGYASFYDGAPVETRLQLQFKETVILDKFDVLAGY
jgi:hypothetical protein